MKLTSKSCNDPILIVSTFQGYGDLLCHTPAIRALSKVYMNLHFACKQPEPFLHNPHIKKLLVFDGNFPVLPKEYKRCRMCLVSVESLAQFPHCTIHGVDLMSLKIFRRILRNKDKHIESFWTKEDQEHVLKLLTHHPLATENNIANKQFVVISPSITWPSRTLPLSFYKELIRAIHLRGYGVVLVGKDLEYEGHVDSAKTMHDARHFPNAICLYNQLTFGQLCALYAMSMIAINPQNGNAWASCTNDFCWNIHIPTLIAPEYSLPFRRGSQHYRAVAIENPDDYYPASVLSDPGYTSLVDIPIFVPPVERVLSAFDSVVTSIQAGSNYIRPLA